MIVHLVSHKNKVNVRRIFAEMPASAIRSPADESTVRRPCPTSESDIWPLKKHGSRWGRNEGIKVSTFVCHFSWSSLAFSFLLKRQHPGLKTAAGLRCDQKRWHNNQKYQLGAMLSALATATRVKLTRWILMREKKKYLVTEWVKTKWESFLRRWFDGTASYSERRRDWLRTEATLPSPRWASTYLFIIAAEHADPHVAKRCGCGFWALVDERLDGRDDGCLTLGGPPEPETRLLPWSAATVCSSRPAWSRSSISLPMTSSLQSVSVRLCRGSGSNRGLNSVLAVNSITRVSK